MAGFGKATATWLLLDWSLLVLFIGLFIVVAGVEKVVLSKDTFALVAQLRLDRTGVLSAAAAVLSNVVSNVPAVLMLKPFVPNLHDPQRAWLVIAMAATLAGNFTVVGSVANLIVAQRAKARGLEIGFWSYFKIGAPLTLVTILIGLLWL